MLEYNKFWLNKKLSDLTKEEVRRERLKASRGYSDEKIDSIIASQLSEAEFRENSDFVIDNSGTMEESLLQIQKRMTLE